MGYIVKLIPENLYFVPYDNEIGTTEFRSKAVAEGLFYDFLRLQQWQSFKIKSCCKMLIMKLS